MKNGGVSVLYDLIIDENGDRKGFVSNLDERWMRKPADWKNRIKLAQRMK